MAGKDKLIVALDILEEKKIFEMIGILSPVVDIFKVGIAPFAAFGERLLEELAAKEKKVFLDLKYHDIPNTVKNAAHISAQKDVFMMNFHCSGGGQMLKAAVEGAEEGAGAAGKKKPLLLGVTVLTSMGAEGLVQVYGEKDVEEKVRAFASLAKESGMDGVVASPKEIVLIKQACGKDFVVVTPGIRPAWASAGDQKRILTPREAVEKGADFIVVGRPIIADKDPASAAVKIIEEMEDKV